MVSSTKKHWSDQLLTDWCTQKGHVVRQGIQTEGRDNVLERGRERRRREREREGGRKRKRKKKREEE